MNTNANVLEFKAKCEHGWTGSPSRCGKCRNEKRKAERANIPDGRAKHLIVTENGRNCLKCGEVKSWNEFATDRHGYNQKTATCKPCRNEKGREIFKTNPNVRRGSLKERPDRLLRNYGITYADVVRAYDSQHGLCANRSCGRNISLETKGTRGDRAVIDHNHETGKFRALLCITCNTTLGILETKKNIILGLMDYLNKYK